MPSSWISHSDAQEIRLAHPHNRDGMSVNSRERVYDLANDPALQDSDKTRLAMTLKSLIQEDLTTRIRLRDLPDDEPTKTVNPEPQFGERMFWEGNGTNRELVSRSTIVESVVWDGAKYIVTVRRSRI